MKVLDFLQIGKLLPALLLQKDSSCLKNFQFHYQAEILIQKSSPSVKNSGNRINAK